MLREVGGGSVLSLVLSKKTSLALVVITNQSNSLKPVASGVEQSDTTAPPVCVCVSLASYELVDPAGIVATNNK